MGMRTAVAAILAIAAVLAPTTAQAATLNPTLTRAATAYVGHPVTIQCSRVDDDADWSNLLARENAPASADAFAEIANNTAYLRGYDCLELVKWSRGIGDAEEEGEIVQTLTHEATHLTGITDEGQTECAAVRNVWRMLRILNPHASAKRLKAAYRGAVDTHNAQTGAYRTVC